MCLAGDSNALAVASPVRRSSEEIASIAEQRAVDAAGRGIGDDVSVHERRLRRLQQESHGTAHCFGASRASDLRSQLKARRNRFPAQSSCFNEFRCANCDNIGHRDNSDVRCDFYGSSRNINITNAVQVYEFNLAAYSSWI